MTSGSRLTPSAIGKVACNEASGASPDPQSSAGRSTSSSSATSFKSAIASFDSSWGVLMNDHPSHRLPSITDTDHSIDALTSFGNSSSKVTKSLWLGG